MGSWVSWGFTRNIDIEMHKSKGEAIMTFQTWDSHCREPFSISGSSINLSYKYSWSKSALDTVRAFSLSLSLCSVHFSLPPLHRASLPVLQPQHTGPIGRSNQLRPKVLRPAPSLVPAIGRSRRFGRPGSATQGGAV